MAEKTAVEMALNSISWQLKRIADSLEEQGNKAPVVNHPKETLAEIKARLRTVKPRLTADKLFGK